MCEERGGLNKEHRICPGWEPVNSTEGYFDKQNQGSEGMDDYPSPFYTKPFWI